MTSTVKVDNIQKVSDASNIIKKCSSTTTIGSGSGNTIVVCGSTVTIGRCGGTVALASGASQTGFGRTGTVNWSTTKITADPGNAVSGVGYFTDTSGGAFNVTLPSSPSAGDIVAVADYANTWDTNNLTVARNSSNIEGEASDFICNIEGGSITFVYVDATKGWIVTNTGQSGDATESKFVTATGGTITTVCTNFKVHTFTGPGTFTVTCAGNAVGSNTVSYMVVAGGGAGGGGVGGGGGAGGFREGRTPTCSYTVSPLNAPAGLPVTAQGYPITVGGGASAPGSSVTGPNGSPSTFSTITSTGGGGGSRNSVAGNGGSGGGGYGGGGANRCAGSGNTPPVSPPQGNNGGHPGTCASESGGGGGGAGAVGGNGAYPNGGPGGNGVTTNIPGSPITKAGGGGGSGFAGTGGAGGSGGGGDSGPGRNAGSGQQATANSGGGGGAGNYAPGTPSAAIGGDGGSGIVVIRYKFQ